MSGADPYRRTSLEVQVLDRLNNAGHEILLTALVSSIDPNMREPIICTVSDFRDEGLVTMGEYSDGSRTAQITGLGRSILLAIYSGRTPCD